MNEGGKLFFTGKNAGAAVRRGLRVPQLRVPGAERAARASERTVLERTRRAGVRRGRPGLADGCIAHNDDFLQYYLGAYVYVAGNTFDDEDGNPLPPWPESAVRSAG